MGIVEHRARQIAERYGFGEIRVPMLERSELFQRTSGETSDIVEKQMYVFRDSDEAQTAVALRPEGTAGVVRAYIEAGLDRSDPEQRFFYSGPMFRRERPQKGRYRQHTQFGFEVFGRADPACDAELLIMIDDLRIALGLEVRFEINSLGCAECRPAFRAALLQFGREHLAELCQDCHARIERNPMRILDCKVDVKATENAPRTADYLCDACRAHFGAIEASLDAAQVNYAVNPRMVRGLDYYNRTTFEIIAAGLGSQSTIIAGGRYDGLVSALGGAQVAGIGFGMGVERVALAMAAAGAENVASLDAAIIPIGADSLGEVARLARRLRAAGIRAETLSPDRKVKALMARANKLGARFAIIIGADEIARGVVQLKDMARNAQSEVPIADIADAIVAARRA